MRMVCLTISAIVMLLAAAPASAQTFDPSYPVCLQIFGADGNVIECRYSTMGECMASASGRSGHCMVNPYRREDPARPAPAAPPPR